MVKPSFSFPPSTIPPHNSFSIMSPYFSTPYNEDLPFVKNSNFIVNNINRNIVFKVKSSIFSNNPVLVDVTTNPIVTLRAKVNLLVHYILCILSF